MLEPDVKELFFISRSLQPCSLHLSSQMGTLNLTANILVNSQFQHQHLFLKFCVKRCDKTVHNENSVISVLQLGIYKSCLSLHKLQMFYTHVNICRSMSHLRRHTSLHMQAYIKYIYRQIDVAAQKQYSSSKKFILRTKNKRSLVLCFLNITNVY